MKPSNVSLCSGRGSNPHALLWARDFKPDQNAIGDNDLGGSRNGDATNSGQQTPASTHTSASPFATRWCPRCETDKPLTDFGTRLRRGRRYSLPYCRACHIAYHKSWRDTAEGKAKYNTAETASKRRYPERERARRALRRAVARGAIIRGGCVVGGDCAGKIEAHHDDYSKPLEVRWVCRRHHRQLDRQRRAS